jgi:hypothetical protein
LCAQRLSASLTSPQWQAVAAFARHNGIPIATDPLTGARRLGSIHKPKVEALPD